MHTTSTRFPYASCSDDSPVERFNATMAAERRRLEEDQDALRAREDNLREYEARLRAMQAEIEAARLTKAGEPPATTMVTPSIFHHSAPETQTEDNPALEAGWKKLHRARELLEAEQAHLRDDRMATLEQALAVQRREKAVAERERQLAAGEAVSVPAPTCAPEAEPEPAPAPSLSRAPFQFARMVLGKRSTG